MNTEPQRITSRDNPLLVKLRRLVQDGAAYRRGGAVWVEGEHLCEAALARGVPVQLALIGDSGMALESLRRLAAAVPRSAVLPDALMRQLATLESPAPIGFVLAAPERTLTVRRGVATVVLDRLQDPGNVGSILRSAAALGVTQVVAMKGTVALWSPKVLRAGMGAHFSLHLVEEGDHGVIENLGVPLLATSSHGGRTLGSTSLPHPAAWVFGHEGRGVGEALMSRCEMALRIPQPGGQESLNVAAAAAVCLYESARLAAADSAS